MKLVTSNPNKLAEFKGFGLDLEAFDGADLREVQGTIDEVILHKAKDAGAGLVVEDTILEINGEEVVDIRWRIAQLSDKVGTPANWIVSLGYNTGTHIRVYRGVIPGILISGVASVNSFGFDPFFVPAGQDRTLEVLAQLGLKGNYSARKRAVEAMLTDKPVLVMALSDIADWGGAYQH